MSEDFSGLPEYKSRRERRAEHLERKATERRSDPYRGRRARVLLIGGFTIGLLVISLSLVVLYAPAPYLGVNHAALASSVGGASSKGCHPAGDGWICWKGGEGAAERYKVRADWAGCWTAESIGRGPGRDAQPEITGCVSIIDHLTAD